MASCRRRSHRMRSKSVSRPTTRSADTNGRGSSIVWNDPINLMSYVTLRVPEAVRLQPGAGHEAHARRPPRREGGRSRAAGARRRSSTSPACTLTGCGRRCARTEWRFCLAAGSSGRARGDRAPPSRGRARPPALSPPQLRRCSTRGRATLLGRLFPPAYEDDRPAGRVPRADARTTPRIGPATRLRRWRRPSRPNG